MIRSRILRAALGLLSAITLASCGGTADNSSQPGTGKGSEAKSPPKGPKLLFISNGSSDWWKAVEKGMDDAGQSLGADVKLRLNKGEVQGQVDLLKNAMSLPGLQGVAVSVLEADAPGIADAMRDLQKAGKIVVTIDSDVSPSHADLRSGYIGTENTKAGEVAGKAAALVRPEGGKVLAFVGTFAAANARSRRDGFLTGAGAKFKLEPSQSFEDGTDFNKARSNVQTAITKVPDAAVLLGLYSYNAPAIAQEVGGSAELRKKVSVVTFDLDEATVGHLEKGNIDVSVCQNPYEMGYQAVKLLKALIEKDEKTVKEVLPDGSTRDTGVRVIVPKADSPVKALGSEVITVDEMKTWLTSKGLKSS